MAIPKALAQELKLPVSFKPNGDMVSLGEYVVSKTNGDTGYVLALSSLSFNQRAEITAERIRQEPEVKLAAIGAGIIDKQRAIAEVKARSPLGQSLIEAEEYVIKKLIDEVENGKLKGIIKEIYE